MNRTIVIACMFLLLAPMSAIASDLVIDAPDTVPVGNLFVITVTADGSPVCNATVICSLGGGQFFLVPTNASGMTVFMPPVTGELLITAIRSPEHTQGSKTIMVVESIKGDLNGDSALTSADAAIALEIAVGSREYNPVADVSGDDRVTSLDALMIMQAAAGAISL